MKKFVITLFLLILSSSMAWADQIRFVQVTDVHLTASSNNQTSKSAEILKEAVNSINKLNDISFVVFTGDNIDKAKKENLKEFCEITKNLKKPYYIVLGNHDAYKAGGIGKDEYIKIVKEYNKYQKSEKPYYYFFPNKDFIAIIMDGSTKLIPSSHGNYLDTNLDWLDKTLTRYKDKKALIFQHFPLVTPYEDKTHEILYPEKYYAVLKKHPDNVFAIFSGHYHSAKITNTDNVAHISSPALSEHPYSYRLVEINYEEKSIFNDNLKIDLNTKIINLEKPENSIIQDTN